jgi:hypothetical protein
MNIPEMFNHCCPIPHDEDQPNTKRTHTNNTLEVPIGPITKNRAKMLKETLNGLVQNIWSKTFCLYPDPMKKMGSLIMYLLRMVLI